MKRTSFMMALCLLLASCATYQPIPEGYTGPLATIADSWEGVSGTKVYFFQLSKVNGRDVATSSWETSQSNYGRGFAMSVVSIDRQVPASVSVLHIEAVTHVASPILALGGGMYSIEGDIEVQLEPDKTYFVKGTLSKEYAAVWLQDANGKVVSQKIQKTSK